MSRYILIRRLRGPVLLLLVGVLALLRQAHIIDRFWHLFWPLLLITFGVLLLAERMTLSAEGYPPYPGTPYPGAPYQGTQYQGPVDPAAPPAAQPYPAGTSTSIVPAHSHDFDKDPDGGQS
jgi:hypothetical protein